MSKKKPTPGGRAKKKAEVSLVRSSAAESACALHADRRDLFSEVVLVGRLREAIRRLNPAIPSRPLATLRDTLLPKLLSRELSVAEASAPVEAKA